GLAAVERINPADRDHENVNLADFLYLLCGQRVPEVAHVNEFPAIRLNYENGVDAVLHALFFIMVRADGTDVDAIDLLIDDVPFLIGTSPFKAGDDLGVLVFLDHADLSMVRVRMRDEHNVRLDLLGRAIGLDLVRIDDDGALAGANLEARVIVEVN